MVGEGTDVCPQHSAILKLAMRDVLVDVVTRHQQQKAGMGAGGAARVAAFKEWAQS